MNKINPLEEEKLIEAVREHKVLYDKRVEGYHKSKDLVWETIAGELDKEGYDWKRWRETWTNLRNQFMAHRRKLKRPSGSASKKKPYFRHEEAMSFLKDSLGEEETFSNLDTSNENGEVEVEPGPEVEETNNDPPSAAYQKSNASDHRAHTKFNGKRKLDAFDESLLNILKTEEKDEFSIFGDLVALKLRKISAKDKLLAVSTEQSINNLIGDAEKELL